MTLRLLMKMLLMGTILRVKVTTNIETTEKPFLWYFCRSETRGVTLRLPNTYIYLFEHSLVSSVFKLPAVVFKR